MKITPQGKLWLTVIAAWAAAIVALVVTNGCSTLAPNADPVVVRAEQTLVVTRDTVNAFLLFEYENRAFVADKFPAAVALAGRFRADENDNGIADVLDWLDAANNVKLRYKEWRTNSSELAASMAVVEEALRQAQRQLVNMAEQE